jgi:hypothetical protein
MAKKKSNGNGPVTSDRIVYSHGKVPKVYEPVLLDRDSDIQILLGAAKAAGDSLDSASFQIEEGRMDAEAANWVAMGCSMLLKNAVENLERKQKKNGKYCEQVWPPYVKPAAALAA